MACIRYITQPCVTRHLIKIVARRIRKEELVTGSIDDELRHCISVDILIWVNDLEKIKVCRILYSAENFEINVILNSISIETVNIRGSEIDWPDLYYHTLPRNREVYRDLNITSYITLSGTYTIIDGRNYTQATGNIFVKTGGMLLVYIKSPPIIYRDNIGQQIVLILGTQNTNFITEIIVESAV